MAFPRRFFSMTAVLVALLLVCALCACTAPTGKRSEPAHQDDVGIESKAMVAYADSETLLFIDQETQTPYFPSIPTNMLYGMDGKTIPLSDLEPGNIVSVWGNNIMLESYPGQYPGIYRAQVTEKGAPEDADEYASIIAEVISAPDESKAPAASLDYATELANVSVVLQPGSFTWVVTNDGKDDTIAEDVAFSESDGTLLSGIADARILEAVDAEVVFEMKPTSVSISRTPLSTAVDGTMSIQLENPYEAVTSSLDADGMVSMRIEPAYLYVVEAHFTRGEVLYSFVTAKQE